MVTAVVLDKELTKKLVELHQAQLKSSGLPSIYWTTLFEKIHAEAFDAGNYFQICQRVDEDDEVLGYKAICVAEGGLSKEDPNGVFLIDHAWTYRTNEARNHLQAHEGLLERMRNMMNVKVDENDSENDAKEKKIEAVLDEMWKFNQTYKLFTDKPTDEEREPIWYVMDEFGSSIRHNNSPSVESAPFYYLPTQTMYTIMWPLQSIKTGDELTRDYAYRMKDEKLRLAKLTPWLDDWEADLDGSPVQEEPDHNYFMNGRHEEKMPEEIDVARVENQLKVNRAKDKLNVYTDLESIRENLTDDRYRIVENIQEADIIFIRKHFTDYKSLYETQPGCLVNQFPFENVVTIKDLLAVVCRRVSDATSWLPVTYNMAYELPKFIDYYKRREKLELDNHWILKPWNLARSIDTTVTKNLNQIIRLQETGPKIIQKYITNPVLFYRDEIPGRVKFDVRYIVLLRSVQPLTIYTYNVFWLRFANKPYSLDHLDDYEKHFTVMNYRPVNLKQIHYDEFMPEFEKQNPDFKWAHIQEKIFKMIRQVFEGALMSPPPKGIANSPQSRAMYAVDLMLDWRQDGNTKSIEPMICEVNFMPDCARACKYHPHFFNDVFNTLFLDKLDHQRVTKITC